MRTQKLKLTAAFCTLVASAILMAAPEAISTITEYFDRAETKLEYRRSFYLENAEEVLHGIETFWFYNGIVEGESSYQDGIQHGESYWNYKNGNIRWQCTFDEGRLLEGKFYHHRKELACTINEGSGAWKEYDEATGRKLVYFSEYTDGYKNGKEINYDEKGEIYSSKVWERGVLKSERQP